MSEAVLILGDQLSLSLSSLQAAGPDAEIFMAEVADEAGYVGHHQQKIILVFSAMRHFAEKLKAQGRKVHYLAYGEHAGLTGMEVPLRVAVMGCVVNGPGEAREADLGVASGNGKGQIFVKGEVIKTVPEHAIVETLIEEAMKIAESMEGDGSPEVSVG